jgi:hypothetical protein
LGEDSEQETGMTQRRLAGTFIGLAMLTALPSLAWAEGVCAQLHVDPVRDGDRFMDIP